MSNDFPTDPDKRSISFPCIRARQPVGDIFIASIPFNKLIDITYFDVRRVLQETRDFERYLGIQRPLEDGRVKILSQYVNFVDASFPTSIIVALEQDYVRFSSDQREMTVSNFKEGDEAPTIALRKIGRVLDGQHRIAGLEAYKGKEFDLSVTIFVGADISDQAHIFATVNLEQTKVSKSLVYDLFELSKSRSPQKTCHNIVVALDRDPSSPLYKRIKRLGIATEGRVFEPITQATFVDGLIRYMSPDYRADRDLLLRGKKVAPITTDEIYQYPLRNLFAAEKDIDITQIVFNYFKAVELRWPAAWSSTEQGWMLNRTNGVRALLRFFRNAYLKAGDPGDVPPVSAFTKIFNAIQIEDSQFNVDNFVPGSSGESSLYAVLRGKEKLAAT